MELLFIGLIGAVLGLAARYLLPHRETHGAVLIPALGVIASVVLWVGLTWLGFKWDAGWIWWISILGTALVVIVVDIVIGQVRTRSDRQLLITLSRGAAQPAR
jgi:uncharacterized membrane protein YeaQ/YmgE (transglycosylase-associated protein family)